MNQTASFSIALCLTFASAVFLQAQPPKRASSPAERASTSARNDPSIPGMDLATPDSSDLELPNSELPTEYSDFTISKDVGEVNLILSVTDSKGRFVNNLTADDLKLLDNHKSPEKWSYFQARTNLPLHIILAIDVSSSIRDRLHFEQQAASAFLQHILRKETDEAAIVAFGSAVQDKTAHMTNDIGALNATIHALQANGETAMYDAIIAASGKLRQNRRNGIVRPVIILITDGVDTASKATLRAAEEAAARSEASIFALDANSIYETDLKGRHVLDKLSRETGGFVLSARENSNLKDAFSTIEKILRCQYALGYPPPDLEANGSFRPIEVIPNKRGLQIHARNGYYAPGK